MRQGYGYAGSLPNAVSTANEELVVKQVEWTYFSYYKFAFYNVEECSVKINGSNPIYLRAGQGFSCDPQDNNAPITSFIIVDASIHYNFIAAY